MYNNNPFYFMPAGAKPLFTLLLVLDVILKGITLYKSARRDQKVWFVLLLLVNSLGILPLIYLFIQKDVTFSTPSETPRTVSKKITKKAKK